MPQNTPSAPLRQRLRDRRDDLEYCVGVALRDALRTAQSRVQLTTPFLWIGLGMGLLGGLVLALDTAAPAPWMWLVWALYLTGAVAFFVAHTEIKIKERRHQPHGGDEHPAQ